MARAMRSAAWAVAMVGVSAEFSAQEFLPETVPCNSSLSTTVANVCRGKCFGKAKFDVWAHNLDFDFGKISEQDFNLLRDQYTAKWAGPRILAGQTELFSAYDPQRHYNWLDFLPVTVRGLESRLFSEEDSPLPVGQVYPPTPPAAPRVYEKSILVPNCWATVYETARTITQCRTDTVDMFHDVYSTDDKAAQVWMRSGTTPVPGPYSKAKRQFGDVMFISLQDKGMTREILEHAVIFLDQDIVFEKAGTGDLNPYRLTDIATVEREWKPQSLGGLFAWELRRPTFENAQQKSFAEEFSLAAMDVNPRWQQFKQWPQALQLKYALATADNPRKSLEDIDELTLLEARRYSFCQEAGRWSPCRTADATEAKENVALV